MPLPASPLRRTLLHKGADTLVSIGGLHQIVKVSFLGAGQALVKMNGIPRVKSLLGDTERGRAELQKFTDAFLDSCFGITDSISRQSNLRRFPSADRAAGQD